MPHIAEYPEKLHEDFHSIMQLIERRKALNGDILHRMVGGIVQHGVLKGYRLHSENKWHGNDIASQLLGIYEQDVCAVLWSLSKERDVLIDLGAADGFYGLGIVAVDAFARSICFEIAPESRSALETRRGDLELAARVEIHSDALAEFPAMIEDGTVDLSRAVVLCDIEGAEFDLFTDDLLARLTSACVIIETHDFDRAGGCPWAASLASRASRHFHVAEIHSGPRDLSRVPLVSSWNDNDRALILSEGRLSLASWLVLSPLSGEPLTRERLARIHAEYVQAHWA